LKIIIGTRTRKIERIIPFPTTPGFEVINPREIIIIEIIEESKIIFLSPDSISLYLLELLI
jgi:hypothetical protein